MPAPKKKPAAKKTVAKKTVAKKPMAKKSVAKRPAAKKPVTTVRKSPDQIREDQRQAEMAAERLEHNRRTGGW